MVVINLSGKEVKLHFGMHLAKHMAPFFDDTFDAVDKSVTLIFRAHENYLKIDRKEAQQMDEGEIYEAVERAIITGDTVTNDAVAKLWQAFAASDLMKSLVEKCKEIIESEGKKKAAHGKKLKSSPSV